MNNQYRLVIKRIPLRTKRDFIQWADEEFCEDYGMALKWLFDFFTGMTPREMQELTARMNDLDTRLRAVEESKNQVTEEKKKIKLLDGREI